MNTTSFFGMIDALPEVAETIIAVLLARHGEGKAFEFTEEEISQFEGVPLVVYHDAEHDSIAVAFGVENDMVSSQSENRHDDNDSKASSHAAPDDSTPRGDGDGDVQVQQS